MDINSIEKISFQSNSSQLYDESTCSSELNIRKTIYEKKSILFEEKNKSNLRNKYYNKLFSKNCLFTKKINQKI